MPSLGSGNKWNEVYMFKGAAESQGAAAMATYQMYRNTTVGQALDKTLSDFVQDGMIPPALALKVMATFDKSINRALNTKAKNKVFFKAEKLRAYRFCDNVWTFLMERVEFREGIENPPGRLKIVACDGQTTKLAATAAAAVTAQPSSST